MILLTRLQRLEPIMVDNRVAIQFINVENLLFHELLLDHQTLLFSIEYLETGMNVLSVTKTVTSHLIFIYNRIMVVINLVIIITKYNLV